jgi:hypothetical protein
MLATKIPTDTTIPHSHIYSGVSRLNSIGVPTGNIKLYVGTAGTNFGCRASCLIFHLMSVADSPAIIFFATRRKKTLVVSFMCV